MPAARVLRAPARLGLGRGTRTPLPGPARAPLPVPSSARYLRGFSGELALGRAGGRVQAAQPALRGAAHAPGPPERCVSEAVGTLCAGTGESRHTIRPAPRPRLDPGLSTSGGSTLGEILGVSAGPWWNYVPHSSSKVNP